MGEDGVNSAYLCKITGDLCYAIGVLLNLLEYDGRQGVNVGRNYQMTLFEEGDHDVRADETGCSSNEDVHDDVEESECKEGECSSL